MSFENLFFTILPGNILYMEYPFGHLYGRTYSAQLSSNSRRTEAVFHLNNILIIPLNINEIAHLIRIVMKDNTVLALKIIKRGWVCILGHRFIVML